MNAPSFPIRQECPPGACICERETLLADPNGDWRVLRLTKPEEKKLMDRLENLASLDDLRKMQELMAAQLGMVVSVTPSPHGVRTMRGFTIQVESRPGLCRQTRDAVPAAIRRGMERNPAIAYAILDEHDLLKDA